MNLQPDELNFLDLLEAKLEEDSPRIGRLPASAHFKRELVSRLGLERSLNICRDKLSLKGADRVVRRAIVSLRSVAEVAPVFRMLWPEGRHFSHPSPMVVGLGDHREQQGIGRAGYLSCLSNAVIRGRSAFLLLDGDVAALDIEERERNLVRDILEFDPAVLYSDHQCVWTIEAVSVNRIIDEALILTGSYAHDFGHWLTDFLPKLAVARSAALPNCPVLIDAHIPKQHKQALRLFFPDAGIVELGHLELCQVNRAWCASALCYRPTYPQSWSEAWQASLPDPVPFARAMRGLITLAGTAIASPTGCDRVFLARRSHRKKRLVNAVAIEAIAISSGFKIVYPEDLPFLEQVRLVHHARYVLAPDGSNSLLSYFVEPDTRVCILNHTHTLPLVECNGILTALDAHFSIVTGSMLGEAGDEQFWNDYTIDEGLFRQFLETWLHSGNPVAISCQPLDCMGTQPSNGPRVEDLAMVSAIDLARNSDARSWMAKLSADTPPIEFFRLADVLYVPSALERGQSLQIVGGRFLPIEAVFDDFASDFVKSRLLKRGCVMFDQFKPSMHLGDVCILGNLFSRNFTHWHEELMKVLVIEAAGIDCSYVISDLPSFATELLGIVGIPPNRILEVKDSTRFPRVIVSTPISYRNLSLYPAVFRMLRKRLLAACFDHAGDIGPRVWLDRGNDARLGRRLINEDEVFDLLDRHRFQRINLGTLPLMRQIAVARSAQIIAGLHGSQFLHSQLMAERSNVIECFSPLYLNPTYTEIYRLLKHRHAMIVSTNTPVIPYKHSTDVLVDCQQLALALNTACEA